MTVLITLNAGADTGPFNLYQNSNGFTPAFATGISRAVLVSGYSASIDDTSTVVRVKSTGACGTQVDLAVSGAPATTTTTTTLPSTTTTTTTNGYACKAYYLCAYDGTEYPNTYEYVYTDCNGVFHSHSYIDNGQCIDLCAQQGSISGSNNYITITELGPC